MNQQVKKVWVDDLRSGKYEQCQGKLCRVTDDGRESFCCLGVLIDGNFDGEWELTDGYKPIYAIAYVDPKIPGTLHNTQILPTPFRDEIGLTHEQESELVKMNDTTRASFAVIADWIEANL